MCKHSSHALGIVETTVSAVQNPTRMKPSSVVDLTKGSRNSSRRMPDLAMRMKTSSIMDSIEGAHDFSHRARDLATRKKSSVMDFHTGLHNFIRGVQGPVMLVQPRSTIGGTNSAHSSSHGVQDLVTPMKRRIMDSFRGSHNFSREFEDLLARIKHRSIILSKGAQNSSRGIRDLAMVHVPTNWGHTVEMLGLGIHVHQDKSDVAGTSKTFGLATWMAYSSLLPRDGGLLSQRSVIQSMMKTDGEIWGMMDIDLRVASPVGCDLYYAPQKYWPREIAQKYFRDRKVFGIIRDPYDKLVNEFRMQILPFTSMYAGVSRKKVSKREGIMEREAPPYTGPFGMYSRCDVNAFLRLELEKVRKNRFRANCHFVPQSEYLEGEYGITLPVDARKLPDSFNHLMGEHGYSFRMNNTFHNVVCPNVWAGSLDADVKETIRELYADDFDFLCKTWGYCNRDEMFCMRNMSHMCPESKSKSESKVGPLSMDK